MRPILAPNCLLQVEQERSEKENSVGDALAFHCTCFCLVFYGSNLYQNVVQKNAFAFYGSNLYLNMVEATGCHIFV